MNTAPRGARLRRRSVANPIRIVSPLTTVALLASASCLSPPSEPVAEPAAATEVVTSAVKGDNLVGTNLVGINLVGANLVGVNMGGPNMGGTNLVGVNLVGVNMGGTNIGGNNIAGNNMAATNLVGANLVGVNLVGANLVGVNLGASNLNGSNVAGTNPTGNNLASMNVVGLNLASTNSGYDMHNLGAVNGMLWSGEDVWMPETDQRIVLGLGSTAFPKLLSQQNANARISVALGKLPWGFSATAGGPMQLEAWEAFVWGDKSYASFLLVAPPGSSWPGVAGFIKAVFRWNAPPSQLVDISGIEASAPHDPTLSTQVLTYPGMMNAGPRFMSGQIDESDFMAGLMAFVTATTNNQTVRVDFSSWVRDSSQEAIVLGNVESTELPQYAEGAYHTSLNDDGTVAVSLSPLSVPASSGLISSQAELATSYTAFRYGFAPKPVPSRCSGALYLGLTQGVPMPLGKCDAGLGWTDSPVGWPVGHKAWSTVHGTTAPMNQYMFLPSGSGAYERTPGRGLLSETYIFMWEPNHVLPATAIGGTSNGADRTSLGVAVSSHASCSTDTGPENAFNGTLSGKWCATGNPSSAAPRSLMYMWGASIPITTYRMTSAPDFPARDPRSWTLQGCSGSCTAASDTGWVTLDTRTNQTFARLQTNTYGFSNSTAYAQYRLRITASGGDATGVQLRELQLSDSGGAVVPLSSTERTENGTVSWTGSPCSVSELPTRAFDNLMSNKGATRWCVAGVPSAARPISLGYTLPGGPMLVQQYRITVGSDYPARDPKSWTFQGCNGTCTVGSDAGWVTLHTRSGNTFTARYQTTGWLFSNTVAYSQYRLRVTANNGDTSAMQIGELQLF
jgi:hypothetical protein